MTAYRPRPSAITPPDGLLPLLDPRALRRSDVGSKASVLARLAQAGFPVPEGYVIPHSILETGAGLYAVLQWISARFADTTVAVRSSAVCEDSEAASFAGVFETYLGVSSALISESVRRCVDAASQQRVLTYQHMVGVEGPVHMSVLVQSMVPAEVAGVAFSTDPLSEDSTGPLVTVAEGLGEGVVEGRSVEEWVLTGNAARCRLSQNILTPEEALAVGQLLSRVEDELGPGIDMEWARTGGDLTVLQARPMTAHTERIVWSIPHSGMWLRGIRLGEWLPEPVTPSFDTWVLESLEEGFRRRQRAHAGFLTPGPAHALVHGWYFHSPVGTSDSRLILQGLARRPRFAAGVLLASVDPRLADRLTYGALRERALAHWLPEYRTSVDRETRRFSEMPSSSIPRLIDAVCRAASDVLWALVMIGGAAWRSESALLRLLERTVGLELAAESPMLLANPDPPELAGHATFSLDWVRPTLGEHAPKDRATQHPARRVPRNVDVKRTRSELEARFRDRLRCEPKQLRRFEQLLQVARLHAATRDDIGAALTYGWPLLRSAAQTLGEHLVSQGTVEHSELFYFLFRDEVEQALAGRWPADLSATARLRRHQWESNRRLVPPLTIGTPSYFVRRLLPSPRDRGRVFPADALIGVAASPGTAVGKARVLRDLTQIESVRDGDILVVVATPPAITVVFDRIGGLCVDSGSVAAHASIVAREFGVPTVVGLTDATRRLVDDDQVMVDGTNGYVRTL